MKTLINYKEAEWLRKYIRRNKGSNIKNFMPPLWEKYLKILPPIGILEGFPIEMYTYNPDKIEDINKNIEIENKYSITDVNLGIPREKLKPITYKELCEKHNVAFDSSTSLSSFYDYYGRPVPHIGYLKKEEIKQVEEVLKYLPDEKVFYYGESLHGKYGKYYKDWLCIGKKEELTDIIKKADYDYSKYPSYIWNSSKDWLIFFVEDLPFLFFGCDNETAVKLLSDKNLEVVLIKYE